MRITLPPPRWAPPLRAPSQMPPLSPVAHSRASPLAQPSPLLALVLWCVASATRAQQCVYTVAGGNGGGFSVLRNGEGVPATEARLSFPNSVSPHAGGYVIADTNNHIIRFVNGSSGILTTLVGTPLQPGFGGDGGPATLALLNSPFSVVSTPFGLVIADSNNNAIRVVSSSGTIVTVAGRGGVNSDNISATDASLNYPLAVAVNTTDLIIADTNNFRVRRVNASGVITTIAGCGVSGFSGDGGPATLAQISTVNGVAVYRAGVLVADSNSNRVRVVGEDGRISTVAGNGGYWTAASVVGPAISMQLRSLAGVAADGTSGGFLVSDASNGSIWRVNASGWVWSVIQGLGGPGAAVNVPSRPDSLTADIVFVDLGNSAVRRVDVNGTVSLVAGRGGAGYNVDYLADGDAPASAARLSAPNGVSMGHNGTYYVADSNNHIIRRVSVTGAMTVVAGSPTRFGYAGDGGPATAARLNFPTYVVLYTPVGMQPGGFLVVDSGNHAIRFVQSSGIITTIAGGHGGAGDTGDGGLAINASVFSPRSVALDGMGGFIIASTYAALRWVNASGFICTLAGGNATGYSGDGGPATRALLSGPMGVAWEAGGESVLVADVFNCALRRINMTTRNISTVIGQYGRGFNQFEPASGVGPATAARFITPRCVVPFGDGYLVADTGNHVIRFINDTSGVISTVAGTPTVFGCRGDGAAASSALLSSPYGVAAYLSGFLVVDTSNSVIRYVNASTGVITSVVGSCGNADFAGDGGLASAARISSPYAVTVSGAEYLIADTYNYRIRRVNQSGVIVTVAGTAFSGYSGDGGPATFAQLGLVNAIAIFSAGLLLAVDVVYIGGVRVEPSVRAIDSNGIITTVAGGGSDASLSYIGAATSLQLGAAYGVVADEYTGGYMIADSGVIRRINSSGMVWSTITNISALSITASDPRRPGAFLVTASASSGSNFSVLRIATSGSISSLAGGNGAGFASVPLVDTSEGMVSRSRLAFPRAIVPYLGGVIIADSSNFVVRAINSSGYMRNVAGTPGFLGNTGDGGPATAARISVSFGLDVDDLGGILFADNRNNAIRYITPPGMCRPLVNCTISPPSLLCTFSPVAPNLQLNVSFSSAVCTIVQQAPARVRNVSCPLPGTPSGMLTWTLGKTASSMTVAIPSPSSTATASATATSSSTLLPSTTSTSTQSLSPTTTPSSTSAPPGAPVLSLFILASSSPLSTSSAPLQLRDVDAPLFFSARVSSCTAAATCVLSCSTSNSDALRVSPAAATVSDTSGANIALWAPYAATSTASLVSLTCSAQRRSDAVSSSSVIIAVRIMPLSLPLLTDVLLHTAGQPLARSAWSSTPCNITRALVSSSPQRDSAAAAPSSLLFADTSPLAAAFDAALLTSCAHTSLAPSPSYQLTLNGGSNLTLVTMMPFNASARVRIGALSVESARISADGRLMHIQVPSSSALCGAYECGYVPLTIDTGAVNLTCPGVCTASNSMAPQCGASSCLTVIAGDGTAPPSALAWRSSSGLFITSRCDSSAYTDPSSGACANASDPASAQCAFGAGDACSPCPANALCPGGFRAWPLPGYYTPSESQGTIITCPPPATRCAGWSAQQSSVLCGPGYREGSYMCSACAAAFFSDLDASCAGCPSRPSPLASMLPFAVFVAYVLAALFGLYLLMLGIALAVNSRTDDVHSRMGGLAAWSFITVQLVAQAGRTAAAGLPSTLLAMYAALAVSQFSGITLPSSCIDGYPFVSDVASMSAGLAALLVAACLTAYVSRGTYTHVHALALRMCVLALTLIYPTLVNAAMSLVSCSAIRVTVLAYASLDGDGSTLTRAGMSLASSPTSLIEVLVQSSNPSRVCYEGSHTLAAALAWVALILVGIVYPAACIWCVHLRLRADIAAEGSAEQRIPVLRAGSRHTQSSSQLHLGANEQSARVQMSPTPIETHGACATAHSRGGHSVSAATKGRRTSISSSHRHKTLARLAQAPSLTPVRAQLHANLAASNAAAALSRCQGCRSQVHSADGCSRVLHDALLSSFVHGDYRPAAFAFYAVDRYVILCLSVIAATLRSTTAAGIIAARASLLLLVLVTNAALIWRFSPFHPREWWKAAVKLLTIGLTCAIIALNAMTNVMTIRASSAGVPLSFASSLAIAGGAYVVFALCLCVLAALPLMFMLNAIRPPPRVVSLTDADVVQAIRVSPQPTAASTERENPLAVLSRTLSRSPQPVLAQKTPAASSTPSSASRSHLAHALSFAALHSAARGATPQAVTRSASRVTRVTRMSFALEPDAAATDAEGGRAGRRCSSSARDVTHVEAQLRELNMAPLIHPGLSSFARATSRRRSGILM